MIYTTPSDELTYQALCKQMVKLFINDGAEQYSLAIDSHTVILHRNTKDVVKSVYVTGCYRDMYYFLTGMYKQMQVSI